MISRATKFLNEKKKNEKKSFDFISSKFWLYFDLSISCVCN